MKTLPFPHDPARPLLAIERRKSPRAWVPRRERDIGIGYGRSSGYGIVRQYATAGRQGYFRCH